MWDPLDRFVVKIVDNNTHLGPRPCVNYQGDLYMVRYEPWSVDNMAIELSHEITQG